MPTRSRRSAKFKSQTKTCAPNPPAIPIKPEYNKRRYSFQADRMGVVLVASCDCELADELSFFIGKKKSRNRRRNVSVIGGKFGPVNNGSQKLTYRETRAQIAYQPNRKTSCPEVPTILRS